MVTSETINSPLVTDANGVVRIGSTRVTLLSVMNAFHRGAVPEEIVQEYPAVSLAEAYATITYYLQNKPEFDAYLAKLREQIEQKHRANEMPEIRERLQARRSVPKS